jgi:hypothetical protein
MKQITLTPDMTLYCPQDPNDQAFLRMAPFATFNDTTLPSGWTSPKEDLIAIVGILIPSTQLRDLPSLTGHKTLAINTELAKIFGPKANVQTLIDVYKSGNIKGS